MLLLTPIINIGNNKVKMWIGMNQKLDSNNLEFQQVLFQQYKSLGYFDCSGIQLNEPFENLIISLQRE